MNTICHSTTVVAAALLALGLAGPARADSAVSIRTLVVPSTSNATNPVHRWTPDGTRLIYRADLSGDRGAELWSIPRAGGPAVRLSAEMPEGQTQSSMRVTPDSTRVLFVGPNEVLHTRELYSVPVAGPASAAVRLHPPLASYSSVDPTLTLTPDGSRVLFCADLDGSGHRQLWIAPVDGSGAPVRISSGTMVSGGAIRMPVAVSADGSRVVFVADAVVDNRFELWSAPSDGSAAPVRLNPPFASTSKVDEFALSPSGWVIFRADPTVGRKELWSVPLTGPATTAIRLNAPLPADGSVTDFGLVLTGNRVVYRAHNANGRLRLYRVSVDGSPSASLISTGMQGNGDVSQPRISPDGAWVVYVADATTDEVHTLWSISQSPLGAPSRISPSSTAPGGDVFDDQVAISADSGRVVYMGDLTTNNRSSLYAVDPDGSAHVRLAHPDPDYEHSFSLTPDSQRAVIRLSLPHTTGMGRYQWIRIDGTDTAPANLHPTWIETASSGAVSPDGRSFALREGDGVSVWGLYVSTLLGL